MAGEKKHIRQLETDLKAMLVLLKLKDIGGEYLTTEGIGAIYELETKRDQLERIYLTNT